MVRIHACMHVCVCARVCTLGGQGQLPEEVTFESRPEQEGTSLGTTDAKIPTREQT